MLEKSVSATYWGFLLTEQLEKIEVYKKNLKERTAGFFLCKLCVFIFCQEEKNKGNNLENVDFISKNKSCSFTGSKNLTTSFPELYRILGGFESGRF